MEEQLLLRFHRNEIYNYFKEIRIDQEEFQWINEESSFTKKIVHKLITKHFNYFFKFDIDGSGNRRSIYYPTSEGKKTIVDSANWESQLNHVKYWARVVKREFDSPDLWELSYNASAIFAPTTDESVNNKLFNTEEQKYISEKLLEIEKYLIERENLTEENITSIKN